MGLILCKIMSPSPEPMSPSLKKKKISPKLKKKLGPSCNKTVNLKTELKTLYYSVSKLK